MLDRYKAPLRPSLPVRATGALTLAAVLSGCGSSADSGKEKYIDCLAQPGGSVSATLDMDKPGDRAVLGDKRQRPPHPEVGVFDDTFKIEVVTPVSPPDHTESPNSVRPDRTKNPNIVIASSNSGASPLGVDGTLEQIRTASEFLFFHGPRQPGQDPPYYRLTASPESRDSTIVIVKFACNQDQSPVG